MRVITVDGFGFMFDDEDYEKWYPHREKLYIIHNSSNKKQLFFRTRDGGDILIRIARDIMGLKRGDKMKVHYKNGNYLDLRKENLVLYKSIKEIRKPGIGKLENDIKKLVVVNEFSKELIYLVMKDGLILTKEEFDAKILEVSEFIMQNRIRLGKLRRFKNDKSSESKDKHIKRNSN
jgi:hypothetical protein